MFPQEAESKYKNIITGYEVDDISKGKICSSMQSLDKEDSQIVVAFSFYKAQKNNKQILKGDLIDSELGDIRISIIWLDAFSHKNCGNRDDHVKTIDRQDRHNHATKFLDDGDNHMETRL